MLLTKIETSVSETVMHFSTTGHHIAKKRGQKQKWLKWTSQAQRHLIFQYHSLGHLIRNAFYSVRLWAAILGEDSQRWEI